MFAFCFSTDCGYVLQQYAACVLCVLADSKVPILERHDALSCTEHCVLSYEKLNEQQVRYGNYLR